MQIRLALACSAAAAIAVIAAAGPKPPTETRPAQPKTRAATPQDAVKASATIIELPDGRIRVNDVVYDSWADLAPLVRDGIIRRCATPTMDPDAVQNDHIERGSEMGGSGADCSSSSTTISALYNPEVRVYRIPVVVHVIQTTTGTGALSDAQVQSQIDILNEDFRAIPGTNGALGTDIQLHFFLADIDPLGNPTDGIVNHTNNTWFNDGGSYWNTIAWDPNSYLNIYTNNAAGNLGYVPFLPASGLAGTPADRVVCLHSAFGRDAPFVPYDQGRTVTHEVGHYLGLYHTFDFGCGTASCYTTGDRICDTNSESTPVFGCPGSSSSCGTEDPFHNYMDYSDDLCMQEFTPEQGNRIRCSIEHWRANLFNVCESDSNLDMQVDVTDLLALLAAWGPCPGCPTDSNNDNQVDVTDLLALLAAWGRCWTPTILPPPAPPENDDCIDFIAFDSKAVGGCISYDTSLATTDGPAGPPAICNDFPDTQTYYDIWYSYTATSTGPMTVTTCDDLNGGLTAQYDTDLVVYGPYNSTLEIDCNHAALLANVAGCDDDDQLHGCGTASPWSSTVTINVVAGEVYLVRIGGWDNGSTSLGAADLCIFE